MTTIELHKAIVEALKVAEKARDEEFAARSQMHQLELVAYEAERQLENLRYQLWQQLREHAGLPSVDVPRTVQLPSVKLGQ